MLYNINKSYAENFASGPQYDGEIPTRELTPRDDWLNFLGYPVASPLGVPAGPLLNSQWTNLAAKLGFDIVTYKSIRSVAHPGHSLPNILYVNESDDSDAMQSNQLPPEDLSAVAITNSFGMPSQSPEFLKEDIARARDGLSDGQVLVVSVTGTPKDGEDIAKDYVRAALLAKEAGAMAIEANFSCPNVTTGEGSIFTNPATVYSIASELTHDLGDTPLIIKVGAFPKHSLLRCVLIAAANAGVRAVSGINTISRKVIDEKGLPALGENRLTSGICGAPIRDTAIDFLRDARKIIDDEVLPLTLIGVGGVTLAEHFDLHLEAGADFVQSATGMMWDPHLAMKWHSTKGLVYA
ncbi:Dihydroorotate dehydrogenase [Chlamydiales bacterium SCGC AG-110-M15]|nr:Dihydroorotate dehydrogenase [Chlamydiales bacterium SCGC AG-110-M15]